MHYLAGTMLRRLKWAQPGINKPVAFLCPEWYTYLEKFIKKYGLWSILCVTLPEVLQGMESMPEYCRTRNAVRFFTDGGLDFLSE